ncbi:MAG: hypothetical protein AAGD09_26700 [Cyanobacteria bacterium P01_F01_bin.56]
MGSYPNFACTELHNSAGANRLSKRTTELLAIAEKSTLPVWLRHCRYIANH